MLQTFISPSQDIVPTWQVETTYHLVKGKHREKNVTQYGSSVETGTPRGEAPENELVNNDSTYTTSYDPRSAFSLESIRGSEDGNNPANNIVKDPFIKYSIPELVYTWHDNGQSAIKTGIDFKNSVNNFVEARHAANGATTLHTEHSRLGDDGGEPKEDSQSMALSTAETLCGRRGEPDGCEDPDGRVESVKCRSLRCEEEGPEGRAALAPDPTYLPGIQHADIANHLILRLIEVLEKCLERKPEDISSKTHEPSFTTARSRDAQNNPRENSPGACQEGSATRRHPQLEAVPPEDMREATKVWQRDGDGWASPRSDSDGDGWNGPCSDSDGDSGQTSQGGDSTGQHGQKESDQGTNRNHGGEGTGGGHSGSCGDGCGDGEEDDDEDKRKRNGKAKDGDEKVKEVEENQESDSDTVEEDNPPQADEAQNSVQASSALQPPAVCPMNQDLSLNDQTITQCQSQLLLTSQTNASHQERPVCYILLQNLGVLRAIQQPTIWRQRVSLQVSWSSVTLCHEVLSLRFNDSVTLYRSMLILRLQNNAVTVDHEMLLWRPREDVAVRYLTQVRIDGGVQNHISHADFTIFGLAVIAMLTSGGLAPNASLRQCRDPGAAMPALPAGFTGRDDPLRMTESQADSAYPGASNEEGNWDSAPVCASHGGRGGTSTTGRRLQLSQGSRGLPNPRDDVTPGEPTSNLSQTGGRGGTTTTGRSLELFPGARGLPNPRDNVTPGEPTSSLTQTGGRRGTSTTGRRLELSPGSRGLPSPHDDVTQGEPTSSLTQTARRNHEERRQISVPPPASPTRPPDTPTEQLVTSHAYDVSRNAFTSSATNGLDLP